MIIKKTFKTLYFLSNLLCLFIIFTCQAMDPPYLVDQTSATSSNDNTDGQITSSNSDHLETIIDWQIKRDSQIKNSVIHKLHRSLIKKKFKSMNTQGEFDNWTTATQFPNTLSFSNNDDNDDSKHKPMMPEPIIHNCGHFFPPNSNHYISTFFAILGGKEASKLTLVIDYLDGNDFQEKTISTYGFDIGYIPRNKVPYNSNYEPSIHNNTRRFTYPLEEFKSQQWSNLDIKSEGVTPDSDYNPSFHQMTNDIKDDLQDPEYLYAIYSMESDLHLAHKLKKEKPMSKAEFEYQLKEAKEYNDPVNKAKREEKRKHDYKYKLLASTIIIYRLIHGLPISDETYEETKLTSTFK